MSKNTRYFTFGDNFESKFAKETIKNPDITLIELVSNSWDASATKVEITWPISNTLVDGEIFKVKDNGYGMTKEEFFDYWGELGGDKRKKIGPKVELSNGVIRKVLGRNGKGRLGLFGFSNKYKIVTCKDNEESIFTVKKSNKPGQYAEITLESNKKYKNKDQGTYIECPIYDNYLKKDAIEMALSTRFGADPNFSVFLNSKEIKLIDLAQYDKKKFNFKGKTIEIVQIPRERYNKKHSQYQIAWWVDNRCAETNTWREMGIPLDGKNKIENKYVFCIIADFLEDQVKSDWTGFEDTDEMKEVKKFVKEKLLKLSENFIKESHHRKKMKIVKNSEDDLRILNPVSQEEIGHFIDEVLEKCSINVDELSKIVSILVTMEGSNRKYELLDKLAEFTSKEMDDWYDILKKWSVTDAYTVLNELYWRLEIIAKLESLVDDIKTDELHQLQPLFESGLWMFGPKYEGTTNFRSNRALKTVLRDVLGVKTDFKKYDFEGSNTRPDIVATPERDIVADPEGDIWEIYGSDRLKKSKVVGYREVLILELKKGGSKISYNEMEQAVRYVKKIKAHGKLQPDTKIVCYVLGSKVDNENKEKESVGKNATIYPCTYDTIIRNARLRTLDLMDVIKDVKGITDIGDPEINEVINKNRSQKSIVSQ